MSALLNVVYVLAAAISALGFFIVGRRVQRDHDEHQMLLNRVATREEWYERGLRTGRLQGRAEKMLRAARGEGGQA